MLLLYDKFKSFTQKPLAGTITHIAEYYSLSLESIDVMNERMHSVLMADGIETNELRGYGFMQQRCMEDPDGHTGELFYVGTSKFPLNKLNTM